MTRLLFRATFLARTGRIPESHLLVMAIAARLAADEKPWRMA